jgi:predicted TIM-barrel fold metal-dependent hydrolase
MTTWLLDDEKVAYPMYEVITAPEYRHYLKTHPGFYNICIHKGLRTAAPDNPNSAHLGFPSDIPKAARDWPKLNFIMYHACIRPGFWMRNALVDVQSGNTRSGVPDILWTTRFLVESAGIKNVYAELGTTFASSVITFPGVCAHILGQALKFFGEDRIVFGSDAVWYGSPQWQIEAMWRFQIPEAMRQKYGYPQLTERAKRKILGLNSARLYGIKNVNGQLIDERDTCDDDNGHGSGGGYHPVPVNYEALIPISLKHTMEFDKFALDDKLSKMRREYLASGGQPSNLRHGWLRKRG